VTGLLSTEKPPKNFSKLKRKNLPKNLGFSSPARKRRNDDARWSGSDMDRLSADMFSWQVSE